MAHWAALSADERDIAVKAYDITLDLAKEIAHAIFCGGFSAIGITHPDGSLYSLPDWLAKVSLSDMIKAVRLVEEDNRTQNPDPDGLPHPARYPDDRMIAAVYTMLHYRASRSPIVIDPKLNRAVGVLAFSDLQEKDGDDSL